jgi:Domain of unknown function (DUF4326)
MASARADAAGFGTEQVRFELAGRGFACWCPLDQPCHADVLLMVANADATWPSGCTTSDRPPPGGARDHRAR